MIRKRIFYTFIILLLAVGNLFGQDTNKMFMNSIEKMPQFPGGEEALYEYLSDNIEYPRNALDSGIDGKVYIDFVVCEDGKLCEVKTMRDIGGGCGEEAAQAVKKMPNWEPGTQDGKPVRTHFTIPISFTMPERQKKKALKKLKKNKK